MTQARSQPTPRSFRSILAAAVIFLLVLLAVVGLKSYRDLSFAYGRVDALEGEIKATEERIGGLRDRIRRLEDDPATLERLGREELGLVRPGEVVYLLPEEEQEEQEEQEESRNPTQHTTPHPTPNPPPGAPEAED
jgi:cell division protein FtsB